MCYVIGSDQCNVLRNGISVIFTSHEVLRDFRIPPLYKWDRRSSAMLRSVEW
jgi:hypothetical protein